MPPRPLVRRGGHKNTASTPNCGKPSKNTKASSNRRSVSRCGGADWRRAALSRRDKDRGSENDPDHDREHARKLHNIDHQAFHGTLPALTPPPYSPKRRPLLQGGRKAARRSQLAQREGLQQSRISGALLDGSALRAWRFSDAQSQQFNDGETDHQYCERHGIVIEPMLSEHVVHPPFVWTVGWVQQRNALREELFPTMGSAVRHPPIGA